MSDSKGVVREAFEIKALTGFRFLVAFYVFVFHLQIRWPIFETKFIANVFGQGAVGMTGFFMLSGFILSFRYAAELEPVDYFRNRLSRIYPIYLVAAVTSIPFLAYQVIFSRPEYGFIAIIIQVIVVISTSIFMVQAWIPMLFVYLNNSGAWSLSVEWFLYVVFVPFMQMFRFAQCKVGFYGLFYIGIGAWLGSLIPIMSFYAFDNKPNFPLQIFYANPIFRVPEFLVGIVAFLIASEVCLKLGKRVNQISVSLNCLVISYLGFVGGKLPLFVGHNWIVIPAVAFTLISLSSGKGLIARLLATRPLMWLGKISYCFYSFQFHVLLLVGWVGVRFGLTSVERAALAFFLLLMISGLAFHFVEEPIRRRLRASSYSEFVKGNPWTEVFKGKQKGAAA